MLNASIQRQSLPIPKVAGDSVYLVGDMNVRVVFMRVVNNHKSYVSFTLQNMNLQWGCPNERKRMVSMTKNRYIAYYTYMPMAIARGRLRSILKSQK